MTIEVSGDEGNDVVAKGARLVNFTTRGILPIPCVLRFDSW